MFIQNNGADVYICRDVAMTLQLMWKRNARGYYEYELRTDHAEDKAVLEQVLALSTKLDKVVQMEIERVTKLKEANKQKKKQSKKEMKP